MRHQDTTTNFRRLLVTGLAASALLPAAAVAQPVQDGGVTFGKQVQQDNRSPDAKDASSGTVLHQDKRSPDAASAADATVLRSPGKPSQGTHVSPSPVTPVATSTDDGGLDTGVIIALVGGGLLVAGGLGMATRFRVHVPRQRTAA
ncbi:MAG TPA: hypothetical protein VLB47_12025 [Solirubrobacteraceae bacterium]|nr:hypothetical protein [Solirubrobacteraceae bacterium]